MPVLDHTIVTCHGLRHAAVFVAELLGLPEPLALGHFQVVPVGEITTLDLVHVDGPIRSQRYAFLVTEAEFDLVPGCRARPGTRRLLAGAFRLAT